jgi:hypothetical protein
MSTSASSRSATQPAGAGRSASELVGIGAASRARVRADSMINAAHCRCCRIWRSLPMTPYLAALARRRPPRSSSIAPIGRAPSSPRICEQQSAKKKWRRRPAAAAPARAGRSARRSSVSQLAGIGGDSRAREGSHYDQRGPGALSPPKSSVGWARTPYFKTEHSTVLNASGRVKKGACPLSIKIASPCELGIFFAR